MVYTTPEDGSFFIVLEYKKRHVALTLARRDLYFMGWRSIHGTFELKSDTQVVCYMAGDPVILDISTNYRFLCTNNDVGQRRRGSRES